VLYPPAIFSLCRVILPCRSLACFPGLFEAFMHSLHCCSGHPAATRLILQLSCSVAFPVCLFSMLRFQLLFLMIA